MGGALTADCAIVAERLARLRGMVAGRRPFRKRALLKLKLELELELELKLKLKLKLELKLARALVPTLIWCRDCLKVAGLQVQTLVNQLTLQSLRTHQPTLQSLRTHQPILQSLRIHQLRLQSLRTHQPTLIQVRPPKLATRNKKDVFASLWTAEWL